MITRTFYSKFRTSDFFFTNENVSHTAFFFAIKSSIQLFLRYIIFWESWVTNIVAMSTLYIYIHSLTFRQIKGHSETPTPEFQDLRPESSA